MPIDSFVTPFQSFTNSPAKVAFKIEVTADMLDVRTQDDRQKLAMAILESIERSSCDFQKFVEGMRKANRLEPQVWGYPFVPPVLNTSSTDQIE